MNNKLKQIIFNKLYEDLKHVEIIPYNNSMWFINREEEYWYLECTKNGVMWWRWEFFDNFFLLFSMEEIEYQSIISEWAELMLKSKIKIKKVSEFKINEVFCWYIGDRNIEYIIK